MARRDRITKAAPLAVPDSRNRIEREMRSARNALVGSARIVDGPAWLPKVEEWQKEAWAFYHTSGELNFGVGWFANAISRVRLVAARDVPGGDEPEILTEGAEAEIVDQFGEDISGQARLLYSAAVHLQVPGEGWIAGVDEPDGSRRWHFFSADELRVKRSDRRVTGILQPGVALPMEYRASDKEWLPLPEDAMTVKVWRADEQLHYRPDSPVRAALGILKELDLVNRHIYAQSLSRIAGAGILVVPQEIDFPVKEEHRQAASPFMATLIDIMTAPIKDPGSASAVVPLPIQVPGEWAEKIKHITFGTPFDDRIIELRDSTIRRLATALDMPAEVLLGLGDVNHWGAWQIEESGLKLHIDPTMELICHALTIGYLHPALRAIGRPTDGLMVWYDDSELAVRPDKSQSAIRLYELGELSGEALRRETGFSEDDKPTEEEWKRNQLVRAMNGAPTLFTVIAPELGLMEVPEGAIASPTSDEEPVSPREPTSDGNPPAPNGAPGTRDDQPPPPGPDTPAAANGNR